MTGMRTTSARSLKDSGILRSSAAAALFSLTISCFSVRGRAAVAVGAWRSSGVFPSRVTSSVSAGGRLPLVALHIQPAPTSSHQVFTSWEVLTGEVIVIITCMFKWCCARGSALWPSVLQTFSVMAIVAAASPPAAPASLGETLQELLLAAN